MSTWGSQTTLELMVICVSSPHHSGATADSAFRYSRSCVFVLRTTLLATRAQRNPIADTMTSLDDVYSSAALHPSPVLQKEAHQLEHPFLVR